MRMARMMNSQRKIRRHSGFFRFGEGSRVGGGLVGGGRTPGAACCRGLLCGCRGRQTREGVRQADDEAGALS